MKWFSGFLTLGTFAALYVFERQKPLRPSVEAKETNAARNLAIASAAGLAVAVFETPVTNKITQFVEEKRFGLVKVFRLPKFVETILAVVVLDYTLYLWHVSTHKTPFLWRFHRVHHADLDLTASTAFRFHFGEMTISVLWRAGQILLIGVSPQSLQIWQTLLFLSILFHHSNWRIPKRLENKLNKLIVTPRLHGIHHSHVNSEMNSNWSSGLTVWDVLHKTFRDDVEQEKIQIGVENLRLPVQVGLPKMLALPFGAQSKVL